MGKKKKQKQKPKQEVPQVENKNFRNEAKGTAALAFVAIGVGILYGFIPKTPVELLWYVFAFGLLQFAVFLAAPIFLENKIQHRKLKIGFALLWVLVGIPLTIHAWPDTAPTSDLSVEVQMLRRFVIDTPPALELGFSNKSSHTLDVYQLQFVGIVTRPFPSYEEQKKAEDIWWADRVKSVGDLNRTLEHLSLPPGKTNISVKQNVSLSQKEFEDLEAPNGFTTVYFMTISLYEDRSGTHELDTCMWAQNENVVHPCVSHNGPVAPVPHKPLHEKKWYWLWLN